MSSTPPELQKVKMRPWPPRTLFGVEPQPGGGELAG